MKATLKIIAVICLVLAMSLPLAACKNNDPKPSPTAPTETTTPSPSSTTETISSATTVKDKTVEKGNTLQVNATLNVTGELTVLGEVKLGENGKIVGVIKDGDGNYLAYTYSHLKTYLDRLTMGETIILMKDIDDGGIYVESGRNAVIDFNGHIYTLNGDLVGEYATKTDGIIISPDSTITLKNGVLKQGVFGARTIIRNYGDLTLDGFTVDGRDVTDGTSSARYAIVHDYGKVAIKNNSSVYVESDRIAIDMTYGSNVAYDKGLELIIEKDAGTIAGIISYSKASRVNNENWKDLAKLQLAGGTYSNYPNKSLTEIYTTITGN